MREVPLPETRRGLILLALMLVLIGAVPAALGAVAYTEITIADRERAQVEQCQRVKRDRFDDAVVWTRAAQVWRVLNRDQMAGRAEREVQLTSQVYEAKAADFRSRLFHCGPLVHDHEEILDTERVADVYEQAKVAPPPEGR
jgi:hypothetical protein